MFLLFLQYLNDFIGIDLLLTDAKVEHPDVFDPLIDKELVQVVLADGELGLLYLLLPQFPSFINGLPLLLPHPTTNMGFRLMCNAAFLPVRAWCLILGCDDLYLVAASQLYVKRDDAAAHFCRDTVITDLGMDFICEVYRCCA